MKAALRVMLVSLLLLLVSGTAVAMATPPSVAAPATQTAGQANGNVQSATSGATSTQSSPSNYNIPVRVLSPGSGGSVSQSNSSTALSAAANLNATQQQTGQTQAGGSGGPASQTAGQGNTSQQSADSSATSTQDHPANYNIPVRVLSPGSDGSVSQSNDSTAASLAANVNATKQSVDQSQAGGGSGPSVQAAGQDNASTQNADSSATSTQDHAANYNIPVRVLSPGDDGSVDQSNSSTAVSIGANANLTGQVIRQDQGGGSKYGGAPYVQAAGQDASNCQTATSEATSTQDHPANYNIPVRVLSPGSDGSVSQSNDSTALSLAANVNATKQEIGQEQGAPAPWAALVQAAGQEAGNAQDADSTATSTQTDPSNTNAPVRVLSPGGGGSVDQSNSSFAASLALNANLLCQSIWQNQGAVKVIRRA